MNALQEQLRKNPAAIQQMTPQQQAMIAQMIRTQQALQAQGTRFLLSVSVNSNFPRPIPPPASSTCPTTCCRYASSQLLFHCTDYSS